MHVYIREDNIPFFQSKYICKSVCMYVCMHICGEHICAYMYLCVLCVYACMCVPIYSHGGENIKKSERMWEALPHSSVSSSEPSGQFTSPSQNNSVAIQFQVLAQGREPGWHSTGTLPKNTDSLVSFFNNNFPIGRIYTMADISCVFFITLIHNGSM